MICSEMLLLVGNHRGHCDREKHFHFLSPLRADSLAWLVETALVTAIRHTDIHIHTYTYIYIHTNIYIYELQVVLVKGQEMVQYILFLLKGDSP